MGNRKLKKATLLEIIDVYEKNFELLDLMVNDMNEVSLKDISKVLDHVHKNIKSIKDNLCPDYDEKHYIQIGLL